MATAKPKRTKISRQLLVDALVWNCPRYTRDGFASCCDNLDGTYSNCVKNETFRNFTYTLRQTRNGRELYLCKSYEGSDLPKTVFIPHAIKRYAERMKLGKTGDELIRHMLIHSVDCVSLNDQTLASRSVRYKGEMLKSFCVREGAFLGKQAGDIFMVNTFITYDMMRGRQLEEFSKHREAFERGADAADEFCLRFNNRRTLRANQPILKRK